MARSTLGLYHNCRTSEPLPQRGEGFEAVVIVRRFGRRRTSRRGGEPDRDFYIACNASFETQAFRIPPAPNGQPWHVVIDTAQPPPNDIMLPDAGLIVVPYSRYAVTSFSLIVLMSEPAPALEPALVVPAEENTTAEPATFLG